MSDYVIFAVLGLGSGAVLGMLALGILLGYRGSGVVNFSQGAIAMYVAYVWYGLRTSGGYLLPVPGLPKDVQLCGQAGCGTAVALTISMATAALLGLILHLLVLRPLREAPMLARVVATTGFMLLLQAVIGYRFGTNTVSVPRLLPESGEVEMLGAQIAGDRFILTGITIVLAIVLTLFFRRTRFGLATRAAAENEKGASLLGYSPSFQAGVNWVLASLLAGIGGILIAPLTQLTPTAFSLLIIPALAAALLGRFASFGITAAAALVIGMLQSVLTNLPNSISWFPSVGTQDALPFVAIIVAIFFLGKSLPTRGMVLEARLPSAPSPTRVGIASGSAALVVVGVLFFVVSSALRIAMINSIVAAVLCLSLVVLTGYVGQISLFQLALAGISAYSLCALTTDLGIPFPLAPLLAALVATAAGLIAATPALRVRGVNLAIITLAGGYAIQSFFFNNPTYTGGTTGAATEQPRLFGIKFDFAQGSDIGTPAFGILCLVVLGIASLGVINLRRRPTGRRMLALRANERAAAASGVNVAATKFMAFGLSSFIAGLAGTLMAYQQTQVSGPFDALSSISFLAIAYLGGITGVAGSFVAGTLVSGGVWFWVYQTYLFGDNAVEVFNLIAGLGLILVAIFNPEGAVGATRATIELIKGKIRTRRKVETPPPPPTAADPKPSPFTAETPSALATTGGRRDA